VLVEGHDPAADRQPQAGGEVEQAAGVLRGDDVGVLQGGA
jgi:hypothetical protein